MRPVYAFNCTVSGNPASTLEAMLSAAKHWITAKYQYLLEQPFDYPDEEQFSPMEGHQVRMKSQSGEVGQIVTLELHHPADNDKTLSWNTLVRFCTDKSTVEAHVLLSIHSNEQIIRPVNYDPMPPRIVRDLVSRFDCRVNGRPLWKSAENISDSDIDKFVQQDLLDPKRRIPIVVVSRDLDTERPIIAGDEVRRPIIGLANVAVLKDKYAAFSLSEAIGRSRSCWNGAIAVYWPGIDLDDPKSRQLFYPEEIYSESPHRPFTKTLFRTIGPISTFRNAGSEFYDSLSTALREELNAKRNAELDRLKNDIHGSTNDIKTYEDYAEQVDNERLRLLHDNKQLQDEKQKLSDRLQAQEENWRLFEPTTIPQSAPTGADLEGNFTSIHDALERASNKFSDKIEVWKTAWDSAAQSHFKDPAEVYAALEAVAQLVGLVGPWEKHFEQKNFKYKPSESQNTSNMYGNERWCRDKDKNQYIERHLTLGGADRENCLQIYFDRSSASDKIVIGYCGVHKRYFNQGT